MLLWAALVNMKTHLVSHIETGLQGERCAGILTDASAPPLQNKCNPGEQPRFV